MGQIMIKKTLLLLTTIFAFTATSYAGTEPNLSKILKKQPDEVQARYKFRNPEETLKFFGIKPGMTVVEALPGGG